VHKRGIAQKETGETQYWLEILLTTQYLNESEFQSIYTDTEEVMRLLKSSILTKKKNLALKARVVTIFIGMLTYAVF
jgi:four helix bundle protein